MLLCGMQLLLGRESVVATEPPTSAAPTSDPTLADIDTFIAQQKIDHTTPGWRTRLPKPPRFTFKTDALYDWVLHTNKGDITVRLMPDLAPLHVSSTIVLTKLGFYDGLIFHRVVKGLLAQGGDPHGDGRGGPGYTLYAETSAIVKHDQAGIVSGTDGSQFLITLAPAPSLEGSYSIFGEVVAGAEVVKKLAAAGSESGTPTERLTIEKATIGVAP